MKMLRQLLLALFFSMLLSASSFADTLNAQFTMGVGPDDINGQRTFTTVPSKGLLTLTLMADGTIEGHLQAYAGSIYLFGFNTSPFTVAGTSDYASGDCTNGGSGTNFGEYRWGFACDYVADSTQDITFKIFPRQGFNSSIPAFTSVFQLVTFSADQQPDTHANFELVVRDGDSFGVYGADALVDETPEPYSLYLISSVIAIFLPVKYARAASR